MMQLTDSTIKQATDPLVISPTYIDEVTIKKKHQDEELVRRYVENHSVEVNKSGQVVL